LTSVKMAAGSLKERIGYKKWRRIRNLLITMPFLIHILIFSYVPIAGWLYSIFEYKSGHMWYDVEFVGLKFFAKIFSDSSIPKVLKNTLIFSFMGLAGSFIAPAFAILLNEFKRPGPKRVIQTITTFPNFIGWVIVYGLAYAIFSSQGLLNQVLGLLGLPKSQFGLLAERDAVYPFQWALGVWKGLGWSSILYLAAIAGIDQELYEAAAIDGANKFQSIRHVTIPGLAATFMVCLVLAISNLISTGFEQYYLFRNSIVAKKIDVLDYYIYQQGIGSGNFSYSIAAGILKSFVSLLLLSVGNLLAKKTVGHRIV